VQLTGAWQIDVILWMREALPGLVGFFEVITSFGGEMFFLVTLPLLYWCIDRRTGARLTALFLVSTITNGALKLTFGSPRPMDVAPDRLAGLFPEGVAAAKEHYEASGYGFPSGHTQTTVVVWSYLIHRVADLRRRATESSIRGLTVAFYAIAALLLILVPLSRVYLAVHYVTDVIGGFIFGAAVLGLYLWLAPRAEDALSRWGLVGQLGVAIGLPVVAAMLVRSEGAVTAAGTLLGMGCGFALERQWVGFECRGTLAQRAGRFALGIAVLGGLYAGLKVAFGALEPHLLWRFVRYALVGLWGGLGAPWAFVKLKLAKGTRGSLAAESRLARDRSPASGGSPNDTLV